MHADALIFKLLEIKIGERNLEVRDEHWQKGTKLLFNRIKAKR